MIEVEISMAPVVVAHIIDRNKVVINRGSKDGIKIGTSYLFVAEGPEIFDPISNRSLGKLELVRGTGKVIYCQEHISTVESTRRRKIEKPQSPYLALAVTSLMETVQYEELPFDGIEVGDVGRPI